MRMWSENVTDKLHSLSMVRDIGPRGDRERGPHMSFGSMAGDVT